MALYRESGYKGVSGSFTMTDAQQKSINIGFKPKKLVVYSNGYQGTTSEAKVAAQRYIYDEDVTNASTFRAVWDTDNALYINSRSIGAVQGIFSITNNGFDFRIPLNSQYMSSETVYYYFAIG